MAARRFDTPEAIDRCSTRLQEDGEASTFGLTVAGVVQAVTQIGADPHEVVIGNGIVFFDDERRRGL